MIQLLSRTLDNMALSTSKDIGELEPSMVWWSNMPIYLFNIGEGGDVIQFDYFSAFMINHLHPEVETRSILKQAEQHRQHYLS